eukprot:TRINITY_DN17892_c0_g2_i1.p1 TRINITY_DN17892_c0_g2~~TRINITY_DN17892_c0_g2_i1.p1  ORF type:complete len:1064 (+),score=233.87 TRINITY_DN17892_c0_g2_i1:397-3192(+)
MLLNARSQVTQGVLQRIRAFSSLDSTVTVNIFTYGTSELGKNGVCADADDVEEMIDACAGEDDGIFQKENMEAFLGQCSPSFVRQCSVDRFKKLRRMFEKVRGTEDVVAELGQSPEGVWIFIAAADVQPRRFCLKLTTLLSGRGVDVKRLSFDLVNDASNYSGSKPVSVSLIRTLVQPADASVLMKGSTAFAGSVDNIDTAAWRDLVTDVERLRYLDEATVDLAVVKCPELGMQRAEILIAFCSMLHGPLSKINPATYSLSNLRAAVGNPLYARYAAEVADLFVARFDPNKPQSSESFKPTPRTPRGSPAAAPNSPAADLRERLAILPDEMARTLFAKMIDAVENTLRTNFFFHRRYALALRINPSLMVPAGQIQPFGVFFVHGHGFNGFHNRFQNIARGGLRLVTPPTADMLAMESSRYYDEVYGLSHAQELKNKDIPEGGSKAVVLVDVTQHLGRRDHALRASVKAFTNSILDLIVPVQGEQKLVDYLGFDELVYLGPDEQVIPEDINWIIKQAGKRGYPCPSAFMSSKPKAGINHKQYGVTSEGVVVFLDVALRNFGINPDKQPFTVKITGGPDGDVAGNLMRILFRDYGSNARIVGVADGSGCAEDPNGLPQDELLRLFEAGFPIAELKESSLSESGVLHRADTEEGARQRNSMHNRIKADVFVPAGGRPNTMHIGNWESFLDPATGQPTSSLIVEGANIFITKDARQSLFEKAGVKIVKDSSANKCGVITSSFEICASMLLDEAEFLAIKEEVVEDVLKKLRDLARLEAQLLFREYNSYPGSLPYFSERLSQCVNRASTAIRESLKDMQRGDDLYWKLMPFFLEHLPKKIVEVAADRIDTRIPLDYLRNAFASNMASKLLYCEGIQFLESQSEGRMLEFGLRYVEQEKKVKELMESLRGASNLSEEDKDRMLQLLKLGGVRSSLQV